MLKIGGTYEQRPSDGRGPGAWPLFFVILVWVVLALLLFTVLGWLWGTGGYLSWGRWLTNWKDVSDGATTSLDLVKVSLTTIGGIGGVGYLVIKYRERASAERAEVAAEREQAEQKLLSAVQQLGSESPQVRIAGVYSLTDVADTYRGDYRQRVVDILCGYLRTKRGEWTPTEDVKDGDGSLSPTRVYVSDDGAVESTILNVMARHLRKRRDATKSHPKGVVQEVRDEQLWCDCSIDLHEVVLTERPNFGGTTFTQEVNFRGATFTRYTDFREVKFTQDVNFLRTIFAKNADFRDSIFLQNANFQAATFHWDANFKRTAFTREADFLRATFKRCAYFHEATFKGYANFHEVKFIQNAGFRLATFTKGATFQKARFVRKAEFRQTTFVQKVKFQHTTFNSACRSVYGKGSFPESVPLISGLPHGARWEHFDEDGNILSLVAEDSPDTAAEDNEPDGGDPIVQ
ncbi:pentapeptide repeat-containing protein [Actinomyces capricornis]|uniref:Pentapeptide repeat-containing protein n=1 Tax=Actinomyces capricornis TaxID=2755559 RepID=A0ABN6KBA5_9ACTO|nr:pentapeptide repeat-containing protein [Actinomyces capricornis]BDA65658.1 hypothetical protein MANAM107_24920 [Actinomyces capricornis]